MFAVVVTGAPGAGKTVVVTALSDALVEAGIAHAAVDVDEVAWAFPFPSDEQRCEHLRGVWETHRQAGHELALVAEVVDSPTALERVLAAVGASEHLLVRLEAGLPTLRERIVAREPPGWFGLDHLLAEAERASFALGVLDGAHVVANTEEQTPGEIARRVRDACPERLGG